ncbi:gliding motility-associated C-terminal domain-containing protein [Arenibacter sp. F26102]|uniref:T9SS type B sorting domain-containing protein n=1 Tax=Arenibacter sp. F26102 TaxID=2926416 RepID=UPI001FF66551|nr:gliding motility-associated C-terminal domain-containing protein [Arenibacter sp. F26102]MCK0145563.1 gliding motility-associated C-terminal domain-containing protein [Arenibacter sp. F26102]
MGFCLRKNNNEGRIILLFCLLFYIGGQSNCYATPKTVSELNKVDKLFFYDHPGKMEVSPPTTKNNHQEFCAGELPTLASVQINEANILWYDKASKGTPLAPNSPIENNATYYAAQLIGNEESTQRLAVSISLTSPSTPTTINTVQVFSSTDNATVAELEVEETYIVWYDAPEAGNLLDLDTPLQNGMSYYAAQVTSICESITRLMVKVEVNEPSDIKVSKTVNNKHPMIGEKVVFTITVENDGISNFNNIVITEHLDRGYKYVNAKTSNGSYDPSNQVWTLNSLPANATAVLNLEVEATENGSYSSIVALKASMPQDINSQNNSAEIILEPSCIKIYNEFTPNDDGDNDYFRIDCIETFPESDLQVFNRYGALVYQKKAYQNEWRGLANVNGVGKGEILPTGTYFYILKTDALSENKTGWIFLRKE